MKIIANNEREKEIIEMFSQFLADWIDSNEMEELLKKAEYEFEPHELDLLHTGFRQVDHKVNEKECPIYLQSENLVGWCKYCGGQWQGVEDEYEITIEEYERFLSQANENSYHAECLREHTCQNCGSEVETLNELKETQDGMFCVDCEKGDE